MDKSRSPIITVAGHIDHGKTTFLSFLAKKKDPQKEYRGITQHIKSYYILTKHGYMTFLDTPGHFAFNSNRENCVRASDIVLLIIAVEDGVKPQTIEVIKIAKEIGVCLMVAITKIDKISNLENTKEKIYKDLINHNLTPEIYGGDVIVNFISSKTGEGIDDLIDMLHMQADLLDLKDNLSNRFYGIILDNRVESGRGVVTSLILKNGFFKKGDVLKINSSFYKIKTISDCNGKNISIASASMPLEITGISNFINIGDVFDVVFDLKDISFKKQEKVYLDQKNSIYNIDSLIINMKKNEKKKLNLIIKVDVQGSVKVIETLVKNLSSDLLKVDLLKIDFGNFNESDLNLAEITNSLLIGFNVFFDSKLKKIALLKKLEFHIFNVVYDILDFLNKKIDSIINNNLINDPFGSAEIKKIFKYDNSIIAGCLVMSGKAKCPSSVKLIRNNIVIHDGFIESLKIHKQSVKEVKAGIECGIAFKKYNKFQVGDIIDFF